MQLGQNSQTHSLKKYCVLMPKEEPIKMPNEMRQQLILAVRQDQRFRPHAVLIDKTFYRSRITSATIVIIFLFAISDIIIV